MRFSLLAPVTVGESIIAISYVNESKLRFIGLHDIQLSVNLLTEWKRIMTLWSSFLE